MEKVTSKGAIVLSEMMEITFLVKECIMTEKELKAIGWSKYSNNGYFMVYKNLVLITNFIDGKRCYQFTYNTDSSKFTSCLCYNYNKNEMDILSDKVNTNCLINGIEFNTAKYDNGLSVPDESIKEFTYDVFFNLARFVMSKVRIKNCKNQLNTIFINRENGELEMFNGVAGYKVGVCGYSNNYCIIGENASVLIYVDVSNGYVYEIAINMDTLKVSNYDCRQYHSIKGVYNYIAYILNDAVILEGLVKKNFYFSHNENFYKIEEKISNVLYGVVCNFYKYVIKKYISY